MSRTAAFMVGCAFIVVQVYIPLSYTQLILLSWLLGSIITWCYLSQLAEIKNSSSAEPAKNGGACICCTTCNWCRGFQRVTHRSGLLPGSYFHYRLILFFLSDDVTSQSAHVSVQWVCFWCSSCYHFLTQSYTACKYFMIIMSSSHSII